MIEVTIPSDISESPVNFILEWSEYISDDPTSYEPTCAVQMKSHQKIPVFLLIPFTLKLDNHVKLSLLEWSQIRHRGV